MQDLTSLSRISPPLPPTLLDYSRFEKLSCSGIHKQIGSRGSLGTGRLEGGGGESGGKGGGGGRIENLSKYSIEMEGWAAEEVKNGENMGEGRK